jgi:nucleotide-binding universal stress UspA family protein
MQRPLSPDEPRLHKTSSTVVVAVDRDRNSQLAVKWAVDYLLSGASHIFLLHVVNHSCTVSRMLPLSPGPSLDAAAAVELLLMFFFHIETVRRWVRVRGRGDGERDGG